MKAIPHGTMNGYANPYACRCEACKAAMAEYRRQPSIRVAQRRGENRYQAIGRDGANRRKEWTSTDLEFITARDIDGAYLRSAKVCAETLKRSVLAIERARQRCRVKGAAR